MKSVKAWLEKLWEPLPRERRKTKRLTSLPLIAYYWDGSTPIAHGIRDINAIGLYLLTEQRWYPGTVVMMTLQRTDCAVNDPDRSIALQAKVARFGEDGVGFRFVLADKLDSGQEQNLRSNGADQKTLDRFLRRLGERNQR